RAPIQRRPTVVLPHGWSDVSEFATAPDSLWIGPSFPLTPNSSPKKAAALILATVPADRQVNVVQFVWAGAFAVNGIPDRFEYYKGWKNVPHAGAHLVSLLLGLLGENYSQPIHFIGHSLGTAVNAYAAN